MARIEKVELRMVDLPPKVKRTDAIQSFVSQETPIVTITDSDGAVGTGYSYTIGTGGSSVMRLLNDHLVPLILNEEADCIEAIWRKLEFATHATTIGPITALALAAIDTALWDWRCLRDGQPLAPSRDDVIEADDELFFLVSGTGEDELRQLLGSATHSRAQQLPWAPEDPFEEEIPGEPSGPALQ